MNELENPWPFIDQRLAAILTSYFVRAQDVTPGETSGRRLNDETIRDIKQAFADAGYVDVHSHGGLKSATYVDKDGKTTWMTGQEWYDRFRKVSDENAKTIVPLKPDGSYDYKAFGEALAKKAAGLE